MKYLITTILFLLVAVAMFSGMKKSEEVECIKWKSYEEKGYVDYYVADWQKEQCSQFGIEFYDGKDDVFTYTGKPYFQVELNLKDNKYYLVK